MVSGSTMIFQMREQARLKAEEHQLGAALLYKKPVIHGDFRPFKQKVDLGRWRPPGMEYGRYFHRKGR